MKKIKINRLHLFNIKLFDDQTIELGSSDLVLLDGPNGYGKTSVYDCLELLFTGEINRFKRIGSDARRNFGDNILYKSSEVDYSFVKAEIVVGDEYRIIGRVAEWDSEMKNQPNDFSPYKLVEFDDFESEPSDAFDIDDEDIQDILGHLTGKIFSLVHYVEQEDSTYFLKQSSRERKDDLASLFETEFEEENLNRLKKFKRTGLKNLTSANNEDISSVRDKIAYLSDEKIKRKDPIEYKGLFDFVDVDWDQEDIEFSIRLWNEKYLKEVNSLKKIKGNINNLKKIVKNEEIEKYLEDEFFLEFYLISSPHYKEIEKFKKEIKNRKILLDAKEKVEKVTSFNLPKFKKAKWLNIFNIIGIDEEYEEFLDELDNIELEKNNFSNAEQTLSNFIESRRDFLDLFKENWQKASDCPACGQDFKTPNRLLEKFETKEGDLSKKNKVALSKYRKIKKDFAEKWFEYIFDLIEESLKRIKTSEEFVDQLSSIRNAEIRISEFEKFLSSLKIKTPKTLFLKHNELVEDDDERVEELKLLLSNELFEAEEELYDETIWHVIDEYFEGDIEEIDNISISDINSKKKYVEYKLWQAHSEELNTAKKKLVKLNKRQEYLSDLKDKVGKIIEVYDTKILKQKRDIIAATKVPFYIYSGRIVQSFNRGTGFFLNIDNTNKNLSEVKFITTYDSEHDAVFSLSAGQLSALVVSFMIALNKVYAENNLILIDDPVQSMDEINVSSFIEILRNDFRGRQIFLSTHEDHISTFIRYKFEKSGVKVKTINLKDRIKLGD